MPDLFVKFKLRSWSLVVLLASLYNAAACYSGCVYAHHLYEMAKSTFLLFLLIVGGFVLLCVPVM